jgi:RNA polymerase sigma factor (sigma-70 family)
MAKGPPGSALDWRTPGPRTPAGEPSDRQLLERFTARRDEDAFATLVRRHGPMVLGVCRRVLRNREEAQDAFQVTFLVLARKAGSLEKPELLAHWLYGVAYRTAVRARDRSARRQDRERKAAGMARPDPPPPDEIEALAVLDEELNLLPEAYRILLVLCYLEGKTHQEAARQLGCPPGSMSWRVVQAREELRKRLRRRGLAFAAGPFALLLAREADRTAHLPAGLAEATVRAAVHFARGGALGLSADAAVLAEEMFGTLGRGGRRRAASVAAVLLVLLAFALLACEVWGADLTAGRWPGWGAAAKPNAAGGSCRR